MRDLRLVDDDQSVRLRILTMDMAVDQAVNQAVNQP